MFVHSVMQSRFEWNDIHTVTKRHGSLMGPAVRARKGNDQVVFRTQLVAENAQTIDSKIYWINLVVALVIKPVVISNAVMHISCIIFITSKTVYFLWSLLKAMLYMWNYIIAIYVNSI